MKDFLAKIVVATLPWRIIYWAFMKAWEDIKDKEVFPDKEIQEVTVKDIVEYLAVKLKI